MKNEGENQRINDSSAAGMQEMKLLKHYGLLQEELNWPDIISVADNLYKDGHLQCHELEKIKDRSQPRRKAIDILFRLVLGNASSVSAFMKIMKSNRKVSYIAERINMTQISIKEMKRFHIPKGNQQGQSQSTYQEQSIQFSEAIHRLNKNEDVIDQFSDSLLSAFQISISDHTRILEQAYVDGKIHELADLIKTCPDGVYDVFVEVVTKNNLEHVLESFGRNQMVNNKRKYLSFDNDYSPAQKCTRIDHNHQGGASEAVEKIASGLRVDTVRQKVAKASKDLGLEFKEAFGGPLGLSIAFKLASPHKRLRQPFA